MCIITMLSIIWAINSEGECLLDVEKVIGSNPILPTKNLKQIDVLSFFILKISQCLSYKL